MSTGEINELRPPPILARLNFAWFDIKYIESTYERGFD